MMGNKGPRSYSASSRLLGRIGYLEALSGQGVQGVRKLRRLLLLRRRDAVSAVIALAVRRTGRVAVSAAVG